MPDPTTTDVPVDRNGSPARRRVGVVSRSVRRHVNSPRTDQGPAPRLHLRRRASISVVVLVLAVAASLSMRADSSRINGAAATIPPLPTQGTVDGYNPWVDGALPFQAEQTVPRAKIKFSLPLFLARTYYVICTRGLGGDDGTTPVDFPDPCPAGQFDTPAPTANYGWYGVLANAYFYSPTGAPNYGRIAPFRVSLLAFGTIPVSATVHLEQTATGRYYDPLTLRWLVSSAGIPAGTVIPEQSSYGPAPDYGQDAQAAFALAPEVAGTLTLRLSDVSIDRQPIDVGPSCGTAQPVSLRLSAPPGWYGSGSPDPKFLKGKPGSFQPLNNGNLGDAGWLQGTVDIPRFAGCRDGRSALDSLVTSLISGPNNPIETFSSSYLQNFCDVSPSLCPPAPNARAALAGEPLRRLSVARTTTQFRAARSGLGPTSSPTATRIPVPPATR